MNIPSKKTWPPLVYVAVGILLTIGFFYAFDFGHGERRFLVFAIARELRVGMSRSEVEAVVSRHNAPFMHHHDNEEAIILRVGLGGADACLLSIHFRQGLLSSARIRGEDGPDETFTDAPADIP